VRRFIESSRTRDLLVESRQPPAEGKPRPKINFDDIRFESNSAIPKKTSPDWVLVIAAALEQMEMKDQLVVLIGHADARGSKAYNHMLSERRAEAVKRLLIENFGVPADRLAAIGFGKTCLKNPSSPYAPENRRLHIVSVPLS
jgi:outer membrane protein OmpA-like peptidoglycan-associated protein